MAKTMARGLAPTLLLKTDKQLTGVSQYIKKKNYKHSSLYLIRGLMKVKTPT